MTTLSTVQETTEDDVGKTTTTTEVWTSSIMTSTTVKNGVQAGRKVGNMWIGAAAVFYYVKNVFSLYQWLKM